MIEDTLAIGADIGGTHITAALVDTNSRSIVEGSLVRSAVSENSGVAELIEAWASCITQAMDRRGIAKICLAMPGPFNYEKGICLINNQNKYPGLFGVNVSEQLAAAVDVPVNMIYMRNDAGCFLQGELFAGNLETKPVAIGITLGTGLGTAVYRHGVSSSADLWNLPFKDSIAEDYISSGWFIKNYLEATGRSLTGVKEIIAEANEPVIRKLFAEFGSNLGQFLNQFIDMYQPSDIIIGGNISKTWHLFEDTMQAEVDKYHPSVSISKSAYGENAALIGAVVSWVNDNRPAHY